MKEIIYKCDYCGEVIDIDKVQAVMLGHIGSDDSFIRSYEEELFHYHDYCLENILTMKFKDPEKKEITTFSELPKKVNTSDFVPIKHKPEKDLPKLKALLEAGWTQKKIADEFSVSEATISNWKQEMLANGQDQ